MLWDVLRSRVIFSGDLVCQTALRVGAGKSLQPMGTDLPVLKDIQGRPYIPGSSLKGVLRAYVESFMRAIDDSRQAACNPVGKEAEWCLSAVDGLDDKAIHCKTCMVCRVFGSPWLASKVQVRDAPVSSLWFDQYQVRDGVAINRDTQTAEDGLKYDYEVVPSQTSFDFALVADNVTEAQIGMLCLGLRPFERGEIGIGGFRSRGLGAVALRWRSRRLFEVEDGDVERFCRFLEGDEGPEVWKPLTDEAIRETYIRAFRQEVAGLRREGDPPDAQAPAE